MIITKETDYALRILRVLPHRIGSISLESIGGSNLRTSMSACMSWNSGPS